MDDEFVGEDLGVNSLGAPPREVPLKLRVRLLTNLGVMIGAVILGIGSAVGVVVVLAANPVSAWRLAMHARESPGRLVSVESTNSQENHETIYRCRYTFLTPDGVEHRGLCYMRGRRVAPPPPQAQFDPKRRPEVIVEYDPSHPESSRIKGMRVGPMATIFTLILMLPGLIGLLVTHQGYLFGRNRIRLLADGEIASGTLISCMNMTNSDDAKEVPFAEFRRSWLAKGVVEPDVLEVGNPTPPGIAPRVRTLAQGFLTFWTCGVVGMLIFGTVFLLAGIAITLFAKAPLQANGRPTTRAESLLFFIGFLVVWLILCSFLLRMGRKGMAIASGKVRLNEINPHPMIQCTFEFRPAGGEAVRARETIRFNSRLGAEPTEPILFDPARPDRSIPLNGLLPAIRVSPFGDWEAPDGPVPWLRAALATAFLAAGPWIGWMAWQWS